MLRAYSNNITVNSGNPIPFNTDKIDIGSAITHKSPTDIVVNLPGYYMVTLDIAYSGETENINIQLFADNVAIPDAIITNQNIVSNVVNGSFTTIIKAKIGAFGENVVLSVKPSGNITIQHAAIGINLVS